MVIVCGLMRFVAIDVLQAIRAQGSGSTLARALGSDIKGKLSAPLYLTGILLVFVDTRISDAIYVLVAFMWLVPDRRIERAVQGPQAPQRRVWGNWGLGEREDGPAAYRIDVGQRVGRGDAAKVERVVDHRHEKVRGRDEESALRRDCSAPGL